MTGLLLSATCGGSSHPESTEGVSVHVARNTVGGHRDALHHLDSEARHSQGW